MAGSPATIDGAPKRMYRQWYPIKPPSGFAVSYHFPQVLSPGTLWESRKAGKNKKSKVDRWKKWKRVGSIHIACALCSCLQIYFCPPPLNFNNGRRSQTVHLGDLLTTFRATNWIPVCKWPFAWLWNGSNNYYLRLGRAGGSAPHLYLVKFGFDINTIRWHASTPTRPESTITNCDGEECVSGLRLNSGVLKVFRKKIPNSSFG